MTKKTYEELAKGYTQLAEQILNSETSPRQKIKGLIPLIADFRQNIDNLSTEEREKLRLHSELTEKLYKYSLELSWADDF